jgi:hypothetical protein
MNRRTAVLLLLGAAGAWAIDPVQGSGEFRWRGSVGRCALVEINNSFGSVRAEVTSGSEVEIIAVSRGSADDIAIEIVQRGRGVEIRTDPAGAEHGEVHLTVRVPRDVNLRVRPRQASQ